MCITINHGISIEAFSYHSLLNLFISNLPEITYQLLVIFVTNDKQSLSKKRWTLIIWHGGHLSAAWRLNQAPSDSSYHARLTVYIANKMGSQAAVFYLRLEMKLSISQVQIILNTQISLNICC